MHLGIPSFPHCAAHTLVATALLDRPVGDTVLTTFLSFAFPHHNTARAVLFWSFAHSDSSR
jgi:hypothetical protein